MTLPVLSSINGLPAYRKKYGHYTGSDYQLSPVWQTAITEASIIGNFIGIFASSWFQDKYGYRRTIQIGLILSTGFIFIVFYAPNVAVMFIGQVGLIGLIYVFGHTSLTRPDDVWGSMGRILQLCRYYASEVTPIRLRGYLTTYVNLCWVIRQFIGVGVLQGVNARTDEWAYQDYFKGSDLRRTEIACVAWAAQILSGSSFANQPTYFLQQAGFSTANSFNINLGAKGLAFIGTLLQAQTRLRLRARRSDGHTGLIGAISFPAVHNANAMFAAVFAPLGKLTGDRWAQAALVILWIFVYDFTVGMRHDAYYY
ncbi:hypothetical protein EHS25_004868 [Saitozyma podzolica]|uniref:Major facilitator superfamily (MFS) profile domain-containing protein n=1 Tax=Saitozyma podzolica TaxID=1890683 RepID=A0A427Y2Z3_9TREE|nr:hypothetical protein EHS25_004868 [Saitozyma podzolica]